MSTLADLVPRKGAARIALIPPRVLEAINQGLIETVNLNEFLAVDLQQLAPAVARQIGLDPAAPELTDTLAMLDAFRPVKRHEHVARALYNLAHPLPHRDAVAASIARHPSDLARCWAAQWVMFSGMALPGRLESVRPFAADRHFGVREVAWMAVRDAVVDALDDALDQLVSWVRSDDERIRRFASELTRPRGVWCPHLVELVQQPWRGLPLVEPLRADPSRYVQNSVANWLNDASRTHPQWVQEVCARWAAESRAPQTQYIVRRALRTVSRQG